MSGVSLAITIRKISDIVIVVSDIVVMVMCDPALL